MDWDLLFAGLMETLKLSGLSILFSLVLGTIVGVARVAPFAPVAVLAEGYITLFRNIPLLIVLFFALNGLPASPFGIRLPFFQTAVLGLSVYTAAYVAEVVRAGLQAISHGQTEAARSLGLTWGQTMRHILLPQTFAAIIPPLGAVLVALTKNTSLAGTIAVPDLLFQARVIESRTFNPNVLVVAGLMYIAISITLQLLVNLAETRIPALRVRR